MEEIWVRVKWKTGAASGSLVAPPAGSDDGGDKDAASVWSGFKSRVKGVVHGSSQH